MNVKPVLSIKNKTYWPIILALAVVISSCSTVGTEQTSTMDSARETTTLSNSQKTEQASAPSLAPTMNTTPSSAAQVETRLPTQTPTEVPKTSTPTPVIPTHYPMPTGLPTSDKERRENVASISREEAEQYSREAAGTGDEEAWLLLNPSVQIGKGNVTSLAGSPDGKLLSIGTPFGVYQYKADTFAQIWFIDFPQTVEFMSFDPTSRYLGVISNNSIYVIDIEVGKIVEVFESAGSSFAWSPDGKRFVSGGDCQTVTVWEIFPAKKLKELRGGMCSEGYSRIKVVWAPSGKIYAALSGTELYSWEDSNFKQNDNLSVPVIKDSMASILAASPDGSHLAQYDGLGGSVATIIDTKSGAARALNGNINGPINHIAWALDGHRLAISYGMNTYQTLIWETSNNTVVKRIDGMKSQGGISWIPGGKTIIGLQTLDGSLTAVDVNTGQVVHYLYGHESINSALTWNQAGLVGSLGNILTVWEPSTGNILRQEKIGSSDEVLLSWSPVSPNYFLFISAQCNYSIGDRLVRKPFQGENPLPLTWSPDGKSIAGRDTVWDVQSGNILTHLDSPHSQTEWDIIAWSPDGARLASADTFNRNSPIIWDAKSGEIYFSLQAPIDRVELTYENLAWSPDGQYLAGVGSYFYGNPDGVIFIWDTQNGKLINEMTSNMGGYRLRSLAWSPDGHFLATGSTGNELFVWNMDSLLPEYSLTGHSLPVEQIVWSPDGFRLAAVSSDGTIMIWNLGLNDK